MGALRVACWACPRITIFVYRSSYKVHEISRTKDIVLNIIPTGTVYEGYIVSVLRMVTENRLN